MIPIPQPIVSHRIHMLRRIQLAVVALTVLLLPKGSRSIGVAKLRRYASRDIRQREVSKEGAQYFVPLTGHSQTVTCVAYSPNGSVLATASDDSRIKLWDANHRSELRTLAGHGEGVTGLSFNADGTLLASSSSDKPSI